MTTLTPAPYLRPCAHNRKLMARTALVPSGKAIVFVHGFNGSPFGTWAGFTSAISDPIYDDYDIFFFAFKTKGTQFEFMVESLYRLIDNIFLPSHQRQTAYQSDISDRLAFVDLVLVSHSLGSVITRRVMEDGFKNNKLWVRSTRELCFSPALKGVFIEDLIKISSQFLDKLIKVSGLGYNFLKFRYPVLKYIDSSSGELSELERRISELISANGLSRDRYCGLIANLVLHAESESVVEVRDFAEDPRFEPIINVNHRSICKPTVSYTIPCDRLMSLASSEHDRLDTRQ